MERGPNADQNADHSSNADQVQPSVNAETDSRPPTPDPSEWRPVVASWSLRWRQRWGDLANELMDSGCPWPFDEAGAYRRVRHEMHDEDQRAYREASGGLTGWD